MRNKNYIPSLAKKVKVPAELTLKSFMKSNTLRRLKLASKYGFSYSFELKEFLERREKRSRKVKNGTN